MKFNCHACDLYKGCNNIVHGDGSDHPTVLFVGDSPGKSENESGIPFVGKSGQFLRKYVEIANEKNVPIRYTNAVRHKTPDNRIPTQKEIEACSFWLKGEIQQTNPKVIVPLGVVACQAVLGQAKVKSLRGRVIHHEGRIIVPVSHPSAVLRAGGEKQFAEDLSRAFDLVSLERKRPKIVHGSIADAIKYCDEHVDKLIGCDIEASTLDPYLPNAKILCISFSDGVDAICVDTRNTPVEHLRSFFANTLSRIRVVFHNGKYDLQYIRVVTGFDIRRVNWLWDTILMAYAIDERLPQSRGLKPLVSKYLPEYAGYDSELLTSLGHSGDKEEGFENVPQKTLMDYCAMDSFCTVQLHQIFNKIFTDDPKLIEYHNGILLPGTKMLMDVEYSGCKIDLQENERIHQRVQKGIIEAERKLHKQDSVQLFLEEHDKINFDSGQQKIELLYKLEKHPVVRFTKGGKKGIKKPSTDMDSLALMKGETPKLLIDRAKLKKTMSTYTGKAVESWIKTDGLVHANFGFNAENGRLSCSKPNLQNQPNPKKSDHAKKYNIRSIFVSHFENGQVLSADFKAIELRIFALTAKAPFFLNIFKRSGDPHAEMAARINGCKLDDVTSVQREDAKTVNFECLYGTTEYGLVQSHGKSETYWKGILKEFHRVVPQIKEYNKHIEHDLKTKGYVESIFGARRHFDYRESLSWKQKGAMQREAANHPIANTASNLNVVAGIKCQWNLRRDGYRSVLFSLVHDNLLFSVHPSMREVLTIKEYIQNIMENLNFDWLTIPTPVDITMGTNWGNCR